ncbi:MAG: D-glycero-beta-D-manno-heptose 1-phosphate adenylyltransferase [Phycisphaerae bacterium]|nr:D-glycero-beta-D-manno-heptose 1-phosphate adenylyltransferase [Phycisphaerae bacterium]
MDPLLEAMSAWKPFSALVVGDFMLDQMIHGAAERLSADAPVPVLHVSHVEDRPGGAANVCLDLLALRGSVHALGVVGEDEHAHRLRRSLADQGIDVTGLVADPSRPTTVKQNLVGLAQGRHPQKMFRLDFESRAPVPDAVRLAMLERFDRVLPGVDCVCLEDYDKGVCTPELCAEVIRRAAAAGKPVLVDPARTRDYARYRGATALTPNRTEAEEATGLPTCDGASVEVNGKVAARLLERLELEAAILTLDRHGALLLERGRAPEPVPTRARRVYDVTGAGDMFLAALAAARCNGLPWMDSVRFANAAAGLEVEVFGVQPIPLERVHHALLMQSSPADGKLRTLPQMLVALAALRRDGRKVVFTNGCFDMLHAGHVKLLDRARAAGDFLVVGLNSDDSVRRLKGSGRPVNGLEDRARVLGALGSVDAVVAFDQDTPIDLIRTLRPDTLVKGADYTKERVVGAELVEGWGGRVLLVDLEPGRSTSGTLERLRNAGTP